MHEPVVTEEQSDRSVEIYNERLGLSLFDLYLLFYGAFVVMNAAWPEVMDTIGLAELNLAVLFGLGLIIGAFLLSIVYALLCKNPVREQA